VADQPESRQIVTAQSSAAPPPVTLSGTLPFGLPAVFYGLRLWAAVLLALFLAFRLELENPAWAGTTAAIVCQPAVGAALRKARARMMGTVIGAVAMILITIAFPQDRGGFLGSLTLWLAACGVAATLLRNFSTYAGALAGFTAVVIAADVLGPAGGAGNTVLLVGVSRAAEILLGILCASSVLAATDFGAARTQLSASIGWFWMRAAAGLCRAACVGLNADAERLERRRMLSQVSGLSIVVEQAAGEISALPFRPRVLQYAIDGLFATISAWRVVATHREAHPATTEADAACVLACLPERLVRATERPDGQMDLIMLRAECLTAARRLVALPADTPSRRLLADSMARGMIAAWQTLGGLTLLRGGRGFRVQARRVRAIVPDYLPALLNGVRAFLTMAVAEGIWIATAWPDGGLMIVWAAALVVLMAPLNETASAGAWNFLLGAVVSTVLAAVVAFAILPWRTGFVGLAAALGLVLIPVGAMAAQSWRQSLFAAAGATFIPLVSPSNYQTYDPGVFYNNALALVFGVGLSLLALRLMPPLSPAYRARRLLTLTLRDLRQLTCGPRPALARVWQRHVYTRTGALTDGMDLLQHARMAAAFAAGNTILRLRHLADRLGVEADMEPVLHELRRGNSRATVTALETLDAALQRLPPGGPPGGRDWHVRRILRARANVAELVDVLRLHRAYFDANPAE
jgi:uncharacterized membrane protein YccC